MKSPGDWAYRLQKPVRSETKNSRPSGLNEGWKWDASGDSGWVWAGSAAVAAKLADDQRWRPRACLGRTTLDKPEIAVGAQGWRREKIRRFCEDVEVGV